MALAFPQEGKHSAQASGMNARSRVDHHCLPGWSCKILRIAALTGLLRVKRRKIAGTGGLTMGAVAFDTLKFVKTLEAADVSVPQAEAISFAVREAHESVDVATKRDLKEMEVGLRHDMKEMETNLRHDMQRELVPMKADFLLTKWMLGVLLAGVMSLILKAFF
ncbi:CCDC90 family protein [Verminephrobacter eiseniae]|uniref:CCDC90 family protein n=1 Tax=Verminephrobacter eiseniae TaxID=364317 RepID=UPI0022374B47|nr:CCDC90 family protein [Verminephrobacter eiseniae]